MRSEGNASKFLVVVRGREYTIERRANRYRWRIRDGSGGIIRRSFGSFRDAQMALEATVVQIVRNRGDARLDLGSADFGELVSRWYERKQRSLDEGGQLDYEGRIRRDVAKIWSWRPERIRPADIEDFYATLTAHSAHRLHTILVQAFQYAIENDWVAVTENPFRRVRPKRPPSQEVVVPSPWEVEKLLVNANDLSWYMFLRISAVLGSRRSETVALTWSDVDFDRCWVHIRRAFSKKTRGFKLPKTHEARTLRFEDDAATTLFFEDLWMFKAQSIHELYLFPAQRSDSTSRCWHPDAVSHRFKRSSTAVGLEHTHPHALRHFVATHLLEAGWSPTQVAKWLGHRDDTQVRRLYGNHIREDSQRGIGAAAAGLVRA